MPEPEPNTVDLPSEGQAVSVEIDKADVALVEGASSNDEHEEYSSKVQKRIDKLTRKTREAERQQQAAISYAKNVHQENQVLKGRVHNLDVGYVSEYGDRINSQTESITKDLETAIATNDTSQQVELNKKLAQLAIEEDEDLYEPIIDMLTKRYEQGMSALLTKKLEPTAKGKGKGLDLGKALSGLAGLKGKSK